MKAKLTIFLTILLILNILRPLLSSSVEDWKKEFEDICAKTQDAMALTEDELRLLIERCDRLRSVIEGLDESTRKIYLRRLKMCRDMYIFALEEKILKKR